MNGARRMTVASGMEVNLGMAALLANRSLPSARSALRAAAWSFALLSLISLLGQQPVFAQTNISDTYKVTDAMKAKLIKPGDLTLRDANFVEALFAIRRSWGVNIVVGNELKAETVSCEFVDAPLYEILDTILGPRNYGYRPIGNSLVVRKIDGNGTHPLFQTATIPMISADPAEVMEAVSPYLSEHGFMSIVPSAKRLNVIDFPDRLEMIEQKAKEFDDAAREVQANGVRLNGAAIGGGGFLPVPTKVGYFKLNFLKAEAIGPNLLTMLDSTTEKLFAVPKDNRIMVVASEERLKLIAEVIHQLDVPRQQVRIDALIYDASLEDIRHCGVNWSGTGKGNNLDALGVAQDSIGLNAVTAAVPALTAANGALTLTSLGSNFDLRMVVNALSQSKDSRLLSDPSVIVYDQETASFEAVTEIPFQQLTQGLGGGSIGTTAFREAGTTLTVTPQISRDQTITMIINPRFSILAGLTPETNQPIIDRREAKTTVRVRNGETIVIGGLRQRSAIKNMSGIPWLKDVKYLGHLFRDKQATIRESELIVFITPTVVEADYVGQPRQECIYGSSLPELDTIPYPKNPDYPCPPDQWPHRCGLCKKCNKYHDGECGHAGLMPGPASPPQFEALPPPPVVPALPESAATSSPATPLSTPEKPSQLAARSGNRSSQPGRSAAIARSPFTGTLVPVVNRSASSTTSSSRITLDTASMRRVPAPVPQESIPPLLTPATPILVPLEPISEETSPLAGVAAAVSEEAGQAWRLPPADSDELSNAQPAGGRRLAPARPIHVAEQPMGTTQR